MLLLCQKDMKELSSLSYDFLQKGKPAVLKTMVVPTEDNLVGLILCPVTCYSHLWLPERPEQITANSTVRFGAPLGLDQSASSNASLALYPDLSHRGPFFFSFFFIHKVKNPARYNDFIPLLSLSKTF